MTKRCDGMNDDWPGDLVADVESNVMFVATHLGKPALFGSIQPSMALSSVCLRCVKGAGMATSLIAARAFATALVARWSLESLLELVFKLLFEPNDITSRCNLMVDRKIEIERNNITNRIYQSKYRSNQSNKSSMSFSRAYYDSCTYSDRLDENASQLDYTMDATKYVNCKPCRVEIGLVGGNEVGVVGVDGVVGGPCGTGETQPPLQAVVDIESSLLGIDRPTTKCAAYKFQHPDLRRGGDGSGFSDYIQGIGMYKTACYPKVPVNGHQLDTCSEFMDEREVPLPPPRTPFSCRQTE